MSMAEVRERHYHWINLCGLSDFVRLLLKYKTRNIQRKNVANIAVRVKLDKMARSK